MHLTRLSALAALMMISGLASAEVRIEGPVEFGVFEGPKTELQSGERVLRRSNEQIQATTVVPAKLGTKFGLRYQLLGKVAEDTPLTLLYFTPGIRTADGQRHDKFEVTQKLVPGAPQDVMAYEFTESHEVVPGEWRFMVFQGDRLLTQKSFTVR
ncbi:Helicase subunit of the DNA excision repair complex [Pseudomonas fluorescens]|nr:Helicase subunit of the DNA excision repair complex [Pseudomonas fluorescens]